MSASRSTGEARGDKKWDNDKQPGSEKELVSLYHHLMRSEQDYTAMPLRTTVLLDYGSEPVVRNNGQDRSTTRL